MAISKKHSAVSIQPATGMAFVEFCFQPGDGIARSVDSWGMRPDTAYKIVEMPLPLTGFGINYKNLWPSL